MNRIFTSTRSRRSRIRKTIFFRPLKPKENNFLKNLITTSRHTGKYFLNYDSSLPLIDLVSYFILSHISTTMCYMHKKAYKALEPFIEKPCDDIRPGHLKYHHGRHLILYKQASSGVVNIGTPYIDQFVNTPYFSQSHSLL